MTVLLIFVVVFVAVVQAELTMEQRQTLLKYYKQCKDSTGVKTEVIMKSKNGQLVDDQNFKEFLHCMFRKTELQNENGDMQLDIVKTKWPTSSGKVHIDRVIEACKNEKGDTPPETAFLAYNCYWKLYQNTSE